MCDLLSAAAGTDACLTEDFIRVVKHVLILHNLVIVQVGSCHVQRDVNALAVDAAGSGDNRILLHQAVYVFLVVAQLCTG